MPDEYYLRRLPSGCWGNSPVWWAIDGEGYTAYLNQAERFEEGRALRMQAEDPEKWKAYKCSEVDRRAQLIFDIQDEKRLAIDPASEPNPWGAKRQYANVSNFPPSTSGEE